MSRYVTCIASASALLALSACGGASHQEALGETHARRAPGAIDLSLRMADGRLVELGDQRGSKVLVVVLATYDGVSQAAMRSVSRFARDHQEVLVLGIVAEPDAARFVPIYEEALALPFALTYDPGSTITTGTSDLGPLEAVPSFYVIDADGRIAARHVGFMSERDLDHFVTTAGNDSSYGAR